VHRKATMMKVSDPIIFGHVVKVFFADVFEKYGDDLAAAGLSANDGLGTILPALDHLDNGAEIKAAFDKALAEGPEMAMVDSSRGITNLHVPSDVIIDASRSEEHTSELQSRFDLVCRLLLEKKNNKHITLHRQHQTSAA